VKVYILSSYREDGAEDVHATLHKDRVRDVLIGAMGPLDFEYDLNLARFLNEDAPSRDAKDLGKGWGGWQLHIVELE